MSNGDDVLDNWEEIDEVGLTNTLHKIQAERKSHVEEIEILKLAASSSTASSSATAANQFQPMKLLQRTQSQDSGSNATPNKTLNISNSSSSALKSPLEDMAASFQPVMMVLHQPIDEYQSANYTPAISSQTVKILRRPTQSSEPRNNGMRPRQPIKTLQQREQEYAEARLRILGSAKNPEDDVATSTAITNNTTNASSVTTTAAPTATTRVSGGTSSPKTPVTQNAYNNIQLQHQSPANAYNNINYNNQRTAIATAASLQQQQQQTWSPIVGGNVSSSTASSLSLRQQQQESILRLPRGPDGSIGFQTRR